MRPITGMLTLCGMLSPSANCGTRPKLPSITLGEKPRERDAAPCGIESGSLTISMARARCGSLRTNPRSSRAVISRWMPDLDLRSKASFISSKEGGTPNSFNRSWMNMRSSFCFEVSIRSP